MAPSAFADEPSEKQGFISIGFDIVEIMNIWNGDLFSFFNRLDGPYKNSTILDEKETVVVAGVVDGFRQLQKHAVICRRLDAMRVGHYFVEYVFVLLIPPFPF